MALRQRVTREHQPDKINLYLERLYESGFREVIGRRFELFANQLEQQQSLGLLQLATLNHQLEALFLELLDYFIIYFCADLNEVVLPKAILKYQQAELSRVDLFQMILDYLDFAQEKEKVYTDLLKIPPDRLKTAGQSFLFPARDEKIFLFADQSLLGTGKEGFALTDRALYWKAPLQKARYVAYANLLSCERQDSWITINTYFFNAGFSLNLKMLRLLDKLRFWFQ